MRAYRARSCLLSAAAAHGSSERVSACARCVHGTPCTDRRLYSRHGCLDRLWASGGGVASLFGGVRARRWASSSLSTHGPIWRVGGRRARRPRIDSAGLPAGDRWSDPSTAVLGRAAAWWARARRRMLRRIPRHSRRVLVVRCKLHYAMYIYGRATVTNVPGTLNMSEWKVNALLYTGGIFLLSSYGPRMFAT